MLTAGRVHEHDRQLHVEISTMPTPTHGTSRMTMRDAIRVVRVLTWNGARSPTTYHPAQVSGRQQACPHSDACVADPRAETKELVVRLLLIHAESFSFAVGEAARTAGYAPDPAEAGARSEASNALVAFTAVEDVDEPALDDVVGQACS